MRRSRRFCSRLEALGAAREAMATEANTDDVLDGDVEVDGAYIGGYRKPENYKEDRIDRRRAINPTGKCRVVVVMRERNGRTLPFVFKFEAESIATIGHYVAPTATVYADEARGWDALHDRFLTKRIILEVCYSDGEACTSMAELLFGLLPVR